MSASADRSWRERNRELLAVFRDATQPPLRRKLAAYAYLIEEGARLRDLAWRLGYGTPHEGAR